MPLLSFANKYVGLIANLYLTNTLRTVPSP